MSALLLTLYPAPFMRHVQVSKWFPMCFNNIHLFSVRKDLFYCPCGDSPPSASIGGVI